MEGNGLARPKLRRAGIAIPRQLVVLGVDDLPVSKDIRLSSIRIDFEMGGFLAAKALNALLDGSLRKRLIPYGDLCVVHRQSTRHISISSPLLRQAIQLIRQRACSGISVADVTATFPGSRRSAERYFRDATGSSIHQEIENTRHERTVALLSDPSVPITRLHRLVGYGTPQALRKAFRIRTGTTLSAFRMSLKGPKSC